MARGPQIRSQSQVKELAASVEDLTRKQDSFLGQIFKTNQKFEKIVDNAKKLSTVLSKSRKSQKKFGDLAASQSKAAKLGIKLAKSRTSIGQTMVAIKAQQLLNDRKKAGLNDKITDGMLKQVVASNKMQELGKSMKKGLTGVDKAFGGLGESILGFVTNPISGAVALLMAFNKQQKVIADQFGVTGVKHFRSELAGASQEFVKIGLSSQEAMQTISGLSNEWGIGFDQATSMADEVGRLSVVTGAGLKDTTTLVGMLTVGGKATMETAENQIKATQQLAKANNVAPDQVLKDIAGNSEAFAKYAKDGGDNFFEAAVQARKLGIEIGAVAGAADSLLDFQNSLNNEVEASILLGRDVNLQKAREAALNDDLLGLQTEILNVVGSEAEFNRMNKFQREALAKAVGYSLPDLMKVVSHEKEAVTLQGKLADQDLGDFGVTEDTITKTAQFMGQMQALGMQLAESLGPSIEGIVSGLMGFVQGIDESIGLGNALGGVLGILAAKAAITATRTAVLTAMQLGLFNAKTAAVTMGFGVAASMILAGSIMAMVASQTSQAKSLASAEEGGITTTEGIVNVHPQEAIVPISMLSKFIADAMKPIHSELRQTRRENSNYFGIGGSAIRGIGSRVGTVLEETA